MNRIKVSICIPTYKQTKYLIKNLNSILIQDYKNYEVIISDDTPGNNIQELINNYDFHGKLKYFKNKSLRGSPENWNEAISHAKGEYIKILHHDDWFTKNYSLTKFVKMLDDNPHANFAFCSSLIWDIQKNIKRIHKITKNSVTQISNHPENLFFKNIIGGPSATIFRRNTKYNFNKDLRWLVDIDFYIKVLSNNSNFVFCPEDLICTPLGVDNQITSFCSNNKEVEIFEYVYLFEKTCSRKNESLKEYFDFFRYLFRKHRIKSVNQIITIVKNLPLQKDFYYTVLSYNKTFYLTKIVSNIYNKILPLNNGLFKIPLIRYLIERKILNDWINKGKPIPPPHIYKEIIVDRFRKSYSLRTFIESGTYYGDMVDSLKNNFDKIVSIEISKKLYDMAVSRFKNNKNISLVRGDSGIFLKKIMSRISEPCLFWLDGHYSGPGTSKGKLNTPILNELNSILNHEYKHVIMIDDARLFNGNNHYPKLNDLREYIKRKNNKYKFKVENDIIILHC